MNIAIIVPFANVFYSGGVTVQGRMWKEGLEKIGNKVDLVDNWGQFDWNSYDYIILLGNGKLLLDYMELLKGFEHPQFVSAPIIDYHKSFWSFILRARFFGSVRMKINKPFHDLYFCRNMFDLFLVRSDYEGRFIEEGFGVPQEKIFKLPLNFRTPVKLADDIAFGEKEEFCFHSSRLGSPGKNVERLIKAAIKYDFELVLGGSLKGANQEKWLHGLIDGHKNIKYVGWLSDEDLYSYYRRAKVFALPSIIEGVGMVALEAAIFGCEIVLTDIGAPKEYFNNMAHLVAPYDIDDIGMKVQRALQGKGFQPELREYILNRNNTEVCMKELDSVLRNNLNMK